MLDATTQPEIQPRQASHHEETNDESGFDLSLLDDLMNSWNAIKKIPNYASVAGELLFRK